MRIQGQPITFYRTQEEQNRFKVQCVNDCIEAPIMSVNYIQPFIIERGDSEFFDITVFGSSCPDGSNFLSIPTDNFEICSINCVDYIIFKGVELSGYDCGTRQLRFFDGTTTWYSDLIEFKDFDVDDAPYYSMSWSNSCNLNKILYTQFPDLKFTYWFNEDFSFGVPEYRETEEVLTDGNGKEIPQYQKLEKYFEAQTGNVPEFIVDALYLAKMHDNISIRYPNTDTDIKMLS